MLAHHTSTTHIHGVVSIAPNDDNDSIMMLYFDSGRRMAVDMNVCDILITSGADAPSIRILIPEVPND